jgi:AraC-like DNA-binding protein
MNNLTDKELEWLDILKNEINKRIDDPYLSIVDLVQPIRTSRTQLYVRIKKITGLTLNQYIQKLKLEKANQLIMLNTYDSIHQIVSLTGFKKLEDLEKLYFETFKISPSMVFEKLWGNRLKSIILVKISNPNYTVEDLVHDMSINRKSLYRRIKRVTGFSPGRYIRKLRLEKAKELIEHGNINTIKEVAQSVGFQRTDYFSNLYEEYYNYRPLDYLKNNY